MGKITIAVKEPGEPWEIREVEDELKTYQDIVGGYIEEFRKVKDVCFFCNEEGKLLNLRPNIMVRGGDLIVGTIFAVKVDDEGEFVSLTDNDLWFR